MLQAQVESANALLKSLGEGKTVAEMQRDLAQADRDDLKRRNSNLKLLILEHEREIARLEGYLDCLRHQQPLGIAEPARRSAGNYSAVADRSQRWLED